MSGEKKSRQSAKARRKNKEALPYSPPTTEQLRAELVRTREQRRLGRTLRSTLYALLVVAAIAVLIVTLAMPVFRIYGSSMNPTLSEGEIVITVKGTDLEAGDLVVFYYENKV